MSGESHYLRAIIPSLPTEIASKIRSLCTSPTNESVLENLVRFLAGAEHTADASSDMQGRWLELQSTTRNLLASLAPTRNDKKRTREDDIQMDDSSQQQTKKQRMSPPTNGINTQKPLFTLQAISMTSPVRKKVDITIHQNAISLMNTSSRAVEGTVPLSSIRRAFVVPTRGKTKPHWTVILLSSDVPERGKTSAAASQDSQQVIFGIDASAAFTTITYDDAGEPSSHAAAKGSETLPAIRQFLSYLSVPVVEPTTDVFKSACPGMGNSASTSGVPGVEAYKAAKPGSLWFTKEGILWGESKPCEFWALSDLISRSEGIRIVGSGRTCSVTITRRSDDDDEGGEETEFGMVDSKEREGINEWVRSYGNLFGRKGSNGVGGGMDEDKEPAPKMQQTGPLTIRTLMEGSDDEDEDFAAEVSDLDGSEGFSSDSSSSEGSGDEDAQGDSEDEGQEGQEDAESENGDGEVGELDPARHPLLRPGAMPKMSRAAIDMAVGIIENDLRGVGSSSEGVEDDEDDELVD